MRYSTIITKVKEELGLTLREYVFLDIVYHLQVKNGWCYAKSDYFGNLLDVGDREIRKIRLKLVGMGLLIMSENYNSNEIKTTEKWNDSYLDLCGTKSPHEEEVCGTKSPHTRTKKSAGAEQKVRNTIYKDNNNEIYNKGKAKASPTFNPLGAEIIKALESVDPKNKLYYGRKDMRQACDFLIEEYTLDATLSAIKFYLLARGKVKYLPSISTPCELRDKWGKLQGLLERKNAENQEAINNVVW